MAEGDEGESPCDVAEAEVVGAADGLGDVGSAGVGEDEGVVASSVGVGVDGAPSCVDGGDVDSAVDVGEGVEGCSVADVVACSVGDVVACSLGVGVPVAAAVGDVVAVAGAGVTMGAASRMAMISCLKLSSLAVISVSE